MPNPVSFRCGNKKKRNAKCTNKQETLSKNNSFIIIVILFLFFSKKNAFKNYIL